VRFDAENPVAYVVLVGKSTPVIVTGKTFGFVIVRTTSPLAPGYSKFEAAGDATALIVRLFTVAAWPSPEEPAFRPTIQLVAP
jgi:hypothetical protein